MTSHLHFIFLHVCMHTCFYVLPQFSRLKRRWAFAQQFDRRAAIVHRGSVRNAIGNEGFRDRTMMRKRGRSLASDAGIGFRLREHEKKRNALLFQQCDRCGSRPQI